MGNRQQVVVIGLGRFGLSLASTLTGLGHEVLGIDIDQKRVEDAADRVTQAVRSDATAEDELREAGVRNFDIGVVGIGVDVKSSILATMLLKRLDVKYVISKATDPLHGEILAKVGAERVVYPEIETGARVAHWIATPALLDFLDVGPGYGIAKLVASDALDGRHLADLGLKSGSGPSVIMLRRNAHLVLNPGSSEVLKRGDLIVIAGSDDQIESLPASWRLQTARSGL